MTFTIQFGWWIIPALVSLIGFIVAHSMCNDGRSSGGGFMDFGAFFDMVTYLIFFVLPSLLAWLIWSLLK